MRHDAIRWILAIALAGMVVGCERSPSSKPRATPTDAANTAEAGHAHTHNISPKIDALPVVDLASTRALIAESAAAGRVTVIDYWATWCPPCVETFAPLHEGLVALGDGVRPISVTLDAPGDYEKKAIAFLAKHHALSDAYRLDADGDKQIETMQLGERWTDLAVPVILVFDQRGELSEEFHGEEAVAADIVAHVRTLLE